MKLKQRHDIVQQDFPKMMFYHYTIRNMPNESIRQISLQRICGIIQLFSLKNSQIEEVFDF